MNHSFKIKSDGSIDSSSRNVDGEPRPVREGDRSNAETLGGDDAPEMTFDVLLAEALAELWNEEPGVLIDMASASLQRSAEMMQDIVDETRSDLIDIARHREEIDRKQAATRAILDEAMARMK